MNARRLFRILAGLFFLSGCVAPLVGSEEGTAGALIFAGFFALWASAAR